MKRRWLVVLVLAMLIIPLTHIQAQDSTIDPPPASYAEVEASYNAFVETTTAQGSAVIDQFLNQEFDAIYEQFSPEMQAEVSLEQLETGYMQITAAAPIGERVGFRALSAAGERLYSEVYDWNALHLVLVTAFGEDDTITGLSLHMFAPQPGDPAAGYKNKTSFRLPFDGLWYTFWGGADRLHNYHVDAPPQRHAYDFVIWNDGSTFTGDGTANTDYYVYGQTVLAPAAGEVVHVVNDLPESLPQIETDADHPAGNHVILKVAENEYLFLAHMQPGSILVKVGDSVEPGQPIGLVGNSGNTSEPHLHIHLQNTPDLFSYDDDGAITGFPPDTIGLPLPFSGYLADGEPVESGSPQGGLFVQHVS